MTSRQFFARVLAIAAATLMASVACGPGTSSGTSTSGGATLKFGAFGPLSGDAAAQGQSVKDSLALAQDEVNKAGGVSGHKIEYDLEDDAGLPDQAVSVCDKLTSQGQVLAVLGGISSPTTLSCMSVTQRTGTPEIVTGATSFKITSSGDRYVFRMSLPDVGLGGGAATFAADHGWKKIAILNVNDDFGNGGAKAVTDRAATLGLQVVAKETYTRGDRDFSGQLTKIKLAKPDALIEWSRYTEGALIAKQMQDLGLTIPHIGSDGFSTPAYIKLGGQSVEGVYYVTPWSSSSTAPASVDFAKKFKARYNRDPDSFNALAYSAHMVAMAAVKKINGDVTKEKLRDAIAQTNLSTPVGQIKFNPQGDPDYNAHFVQIKKGAEVPA